MQRSGLEHRSWRRLLVLLCKWPLGDLERLESSFLAKKINVIFPKMELATWSEMVMGVPRVMFERYHLWKMLCKFAESYYMRILHVGSAESSTGECGGESGLVSAVLYFVC